MQSQSIDFCAATGTSVRPLERFGRWCMGSVCIHCNQVMTEMDMDLLYQNDILLDEMNINSWYRNEVFLLI